MAKRRRNTNRPNVYASKQHNLVVIAKHRPFDEERWKELLIAMAYEFARQKKEKHKDGPPTDDKPIRPRK